MSANGMSTIISRKASIITAPRAPMVNAIAKAKKNENACRSTITMATGNQNFMDVR